MKKLFLLIIISILSFGFLINSADAATKVRGYYKPSIGRYVMQHYRSSRDNSRWNNWSTWGNYNPYTGRKGYTSPFKTFKW